ncbi:MAG: hypothetical protein N3F06_04820 [Nitrososphaerales archaeon]|nr:hypothetical protein [Nitrososphaerales archaeon]
MAVKKSSDHRSLKIRFSEDTIRSASNALEILFPKGKTRTAATLFIQWLNERGGQATKSAISHFANQLQEGNFQVNGIPFKYSRRNFYLTILKTLIDLGFISRNVPVWDSKRKRTLYVYSRNIFDIPQKPPAIGFWRNAYYICKKWNEMFMK